MIEFNDWEKYFTNKMSNKERHDFEKNTLDVEAESDAFDFYVEDGFEKHIKRINRINEFISPSKRRFNYLAVAAVFFSLLIAGRFLYNFILFDTKKEKNIPVVINQPKKINKDTIQKDTSTLKPKLVASKNINEINFIDTLKIKTYYKDKGHIDETNELFGAVKKENNLELSKKERINYKLNIRISNFLQQECAQVGISIHGNNRIIYIPVNQWNTIDVPNKIENIIVFCNKSYSDTLHLNTTRKFFIILKK